MLKQRIFFILLVVLLWTPDVHAQLIRGYDTFHHGVSISSCVTLREDTALKKIYFRKIIGWDSTQYKISAYDEAYRSLFSENSLLKFTLNQETVYHLTPEKVLSPIRLHPFYETKLHSVDIVLTPEMIGELKEAASVELTFSFNDAPTFTYMLPQKKLDEWKKVIAAKS